MSPASCPASSTPASGGRSRTTSGSGPPNGASPGSPGRSIRSCAATPGSTSRSSRLTSPSTSPTSTARCPTRSTRSDETDRLARRLADVGDGRAPERSCRCGRHDRRRTPPTTSSCCVAPTRPRPTEWRLRVRDELGAAARRRRRRHRLHARRRLRRRTHRRSGPDHATSLSSNSVGSRIDLVTPFRTSFGDERPSRPPAAARRPPTPATAGANASRCTNPPTPPSSSTAPSWSSATTSGRR